MDRDEKLALYKEKASAIFPGIRTLSVLSMFNPDIQEKPTSGEIELSGRFLNEYALENGNIQFIHYTNLTSAMNILNSGAIRIYNCLNLNDPSEITYLLQNSQKPFEEEEIINYKKEHFILSGSLYDATNGEDFNLWRLYGDSSQGIGIVFEIDDKVKNWTNVFLQKVSYGMESEEAKRTMDFIKFHEEFNAEYKLFQNRPNLLGLLSTGIKNAIWSIEKEFRLVIRIPQDKFTLNPKESIETNSLIAKTLKHEFKSNGKLVSYVEVPLHLNDHESRREILPYSKEEVDLIDYVPNLRIKKIILGTNCIVNKKSEFYEFEAWLKNKLKYDFKVCQSEINL